MHHVYSIYLYNPIGETINLDKVLFDKYKNDLVMTSSFLGFFSPTCRNTTLDMAESFMLISLSRLPMTYPVITKLSINN